MEVERVKFVWVEDGDGAFDVEARLNGVLIGYARCVRDGDRLLLADIHVKDDLPQPWPFLPVLLLRLFGPRKRWTARGRGTGSELLKRVLARADALDLREVCGSVMPEDLRKNRNLLGWYTRHGFIVMQPDAECVPGAAKKLSRRR